MPIAGGTASFLVGIDGSSPLSFQWLHGGNPIPEGTNRVLTLPVVNAQQSGGYRVVITNAFGSVTSAIAFLSVDAPTNATIVLQPRGDTVPAGSYFNLSVAAVGTPPLHYQWFLNGSPILEATNRNLAIESVQHTNEGNYEVKVQNPAGVVWSLPAQVIVTNAINGGGTIDFRNRSIWFGTISNHAPIFDFDGTTPLTSSNYLAQLYAGTTLETLRPIGSPSPFRSGYDAGYFVSKILTLPHIPSNARVVTQVRVWEAEKGSTYEDARAFGGKFGRSGIVEVLAGNGVLSPTRLTGLASFNLQAGLPSFTVGVIDFIDREPGNRIVWSLRGAAGFRYVVERTDESEPIVWRPYLVLTNTTGEVMFTDSARSGNGRTFYRARILD
ncbi:MAG: immunoglobulin domain-containing protein [Verrucomicrobia bacterium]|nr:immunoglobulin domain-containing protein [Verrucomicrobiota bacterium]